MSTDVDSLKRPNAESVLHAPPDHRAVGDLGRTCNQVQDWGADKSVDVADSTLKKQRAYYKNSEGFGSHFNRVRMPVVPLFGL